MDYPVLFGIGVEREEEIRFEDLEQEEDIEQPGKESDWFVKRWNWIATINQIANDDRTKWEFFLEMKLIEFLNTVSFYKDKGEFEKEQHEMMMRMSHR
jgi:hypothetical protein